MCLFTDLHAIQHGTWASHCQIFHHGEAFSRLGPSQKQRNHPPGWMQMRGLLCFVGGPCKLVILSPAWMCHETRDITGFHDVAGPTILHALASRGGGRSGPRASWHRGPGGIDRQNPHEKEKIFILFMNPSIIERQGNGFRLIDPVFYFCVSEVWIAWKLLCRGGWRAAGGEGSCRIDAGQIESQHVASSGWLHMEHHRTRRGGTCPAGNLYLMCWWPKTMSMQQLHSGAWMKFTMLQHFSFIFL